MITLNENDKKWVQDTWKKFSDKISVVADRTGDKIPYTTIDGVFDDKKETQIEDWTNGFWPGLMILMYDATGDEKYLKIARKNMDEMDRVFSDFDMLHHDVGFMWNISSSADFRLTGDKKQRNRFLMAASLLLSRYNINGKYIRAWNDWDPGDSNAGWAIIDCMMNIPILYRAAKETGDLRFKMAAENHADTTMNNHIRPDGSCHHIVEYDAVDGNGFIRNYTGQGYKGYPLSSWSRGQAWALYGFALSYTHIKKQEHLDAAKRVAHYFIANVAQTNWLPLADFRAPEEPVMYDSTAGACAACGLIEIANAVDEHEKKLYLNAAISILKALDENFCDYDLNTDAILTMGTEAYGRGVHKTIISGDFFFVEALRKLEGFADFVW